MKTFLYSTILLLVSHGAFASQADDTTITIAGQTAGATPFISQISLSVSDTSALKSIQFSVASKPTSSIRPLSATYSLAYLTERGDVNAGIVFLPVYGLYQNYSNTVTLTYLFNDGSSKSDSTTVATAAYIDPCGYETPTVLQAKTGDSGLSYDYIMIKGRCSDNSPAIIDTDSALRWVGTAGFASYNLAFFNNSVYLADGSLLYRNDLDGRVTPLGDFASEGVTEFHHNVDRGKFGLLFEADTADYFESVVMEIDTEGHVLMTWNMADIISQAMIAGGDDPSLFVYPSPSDWFHNNAVTYNRADDSLIVSSREDFLICIDYSTSAIKWILGDPTKQWYQFASLRQYALALTPGSLPPIGQHAVSVTYDQDILLFDNGTASLFFTNMPGASRGYASPRKYHIDTVSMTATEVWNYPMDQSVQSQYCGSVYEDQPLNYLVDYAFVNEPPDGDHFARILGLNAAGEKAFYYQYPSTACDTIFNAVPLHLESTSLPAVGPQSLNISTRGFVDGGQDVLIAGFIVTGTSPKTIVLRALGPSLGDEGVSGALANPVLVIYDSTGTVVTMNDNWQNGSNATAIVQDGLAPGNPLDAALRINVLPGSYTAVVSSKDISSGLALVEVYDVAPEANAKLANISTRGDVGLGENVLIAGFIVGDVDSSTVVVRALGPSLASAGVILPLSDPTLTVYDSNGTALATNNNWRDDPNAPDIAQNMLAPTADAESATILHLPPGAYTAIESRAGAGTDAMGTGLVEVYNLE